MKKYPYQEVPEGLANIEVEKGETLITPDGKTYNFPQGKKHNRGGIKILAESGAWVASEHQKIKKDAAKLLMPMERLSGVKKGKVSFADLSRKFDTTEYFDKLDNKDGRLDDLRASTAQYMIAKNSAHQANILKAQEEHKASKGLDNNLDQLDGTDFTKSLQAKLGGKVDNEYQNGGSYDPFNMYRYGLDYVKRNATDIGLSAMSSTAAAPRSPGAPPTGGGTLSPPVYPSIYSGKPTPINVGKYDRRPLSSEDRLHFNRQYKDIKPNGNIVPRYFPEFESTTQMVDSKQPVIGGNYTSSIGGETNAYHEQWAKYRGEKFSPQWFQDNQTRLFQNNFGHTTDFDADPSIRKDGLYGKITKSQPLTKALFRAKQDGMIDSLKFASMSNADQKIEAGKYNMTADEVKAEFAKGNAELHFRTKNDFGAIPNIPATSAENIKPVKDVIRLPDPDKPEEKPLTKEVPVGIDPQKLLYNMQQGLLAANMATLSRDLPYYQYSPQKAMYNRFDPVNTLSSERSFNLARQNIMSSNLPEQVKQARLSSLNARMQDSVNQIDLQNYQGNLQNNNQNTQIMRQTYNNNIGMREQANKQYVMEDARGKELFQRQRAAITQNMMGLFQKRQEDMYNRNLISQMSRNYMLDARGNVIFVPGQGTGGDFDQLDPYRGSGSRTPLKHLNAAGMQAMYPEYYG